MITPPPYFSYLLRLWRSGQETPSVWRASLENPMTGERQGFSSIKNLFTFLETLTVAEPSRRDDTGDKSESEG